MGILFAPTPPIPSTEECHINFRSCHDSYKVKILAQNHINFCQEKIIGILDTFGPKKTFGTDFLVMGPNFRVQLSIVPSTKNCENFNNFS